MNIKIKTQILLGYLMMAIMVIILGATGIYFIHKLSETPDKILNDNYKSILAIQNMIDEIDNMDNAIIIYISDKKEKPIIVNIFEESGRRYFENLEIAESNITEEGEAELFVELRKASEEYERAFKNNMNSLQNINEYDSLISQKYNNVKTKCYEILNLNHMGMQNRRDKAKELSQNAVFYMIITALVSLLIVLVVALKIPSRVINPLKEFTEKVKAIADKRYSERIIISSGNELGLLGKSFNEMAEKLEEFEKSSIRILIAEKKRAEAIVKSMFDGIIVLDEKEEIVLVNYVGAELLGITEENLLGRNILEISKYNNLINELTSGFSDSEKSGKDKLNYLRIVYKNKEEFFLKYFVNVKDNENDSNLGHIIILKNVTGFKELDELKSGFITTVSHELRTPLSAINMSLRLLEDERLGKLNEEQKKVSVTMKEEVKRLLRMVNELLNLSKIESRSEALRLNYVKPEDLADAAVTPLLMQFNQNNIDLDIEIEPDLPEIRVDANKISWVLINLLNNAIRYSNQNGKIILSIKRKDNSILFSVKDFGAGIDPKFIGSIFDKFVQVGSKNIENSKKGVGLGLAISKEFVNAHRGELKVKSEQGAGSEFYFTVPISV
ncbi:MAG TPA: ATP-binding protein [Ignavibacteria bacterium]|nr:ATP-binding protein [Ignavibacteria bacterium]HMR41381.1 ATP-binding protein [Ignavibacteria bacterium]